ncbi:general secretion pathway protein k-like protein [Plakobranchus ocellatus]|uniref:General secretion pathway protein k-like protein n=1 Tax=Plakobranchus ocellatus TaxID=259542 RepID=A0AAV4AUL8_9GAST|nr:general secretion pathway protein k-like protein [Plakobranchus ocellatus]
MKVNVNTCNVEDLLKIPGVGEKTAQKIIKTRGESPFTLHSLSDLLRKDPQEIEETQPKKHVRSYTPADERREAPPASQYDKDSRRRQYSVEFQEDQHSRYFREHQRSGQLHNRNARRQYGYDSDELDDEPGHSRKFIQPPESLIYSGESSWAAFEMKFKRFVREQMFSEKEAKDYLCWVLVDRAADYYTLMMREDRHMPLRQLMKRMEQRFASKHLRETALIRFQNAKQRIEESIEDWAECLHHLALYAFEEDAGAGLWKRDIKQMVLKFCTGCANREAGLHAANTRPESLDEATTFFLQYQFNHAAVYGRKEDRSPEAAVRSVRSRRDYSEERSPPRREYRGRDATPVWNRAERTQNPTESWGERRDYSPRQDRPPFKPPQERREVTPPGRGREAEPDQPQLKDLLGSMMADLESRLGRMMDDKLSNILHPGSKGKFPPCLSG